MNCQNPECQKEVVAYPHAALDKSKVCQCDREVKAETTTTIKFIVEWRHTEGYWQPEAEFSSLSDAQAERSRYPKERTRIIKETIVTVRKVIE